MNTRSALRDGAAYLFLVLAMTFAQPSAATNTEWRVSADLSDPACMQSVPFLPSDSPAWFAGLWVQGGNLVAGTGWSPTNAAADSLILGVDRQSLTNDLALTAVWSSSSTGAAAEVNVRLFSASPVRGATAIDVSLTIG